MKYSKLIAKIFAQRSKNNDAQIAVALVAGLAVGAVISILFAPESGSNIRKGISGKAKGLNDNLKNGFSSLKQRVLGADANDETSEQPEVPHFVHATQKRRKSAIKELIHEAHDHHTEQPLG